MLTKVGKYEIIEKIGVGGFGSVYRGRDPFIKRTVAIKTCQSDEDELKKRFFREAEYAGNLHHPNITTIYDFGVTEEGVPYIVQEFLTGEDLDKKIKQKVALPLAERIRILAEVCEGLGYAHGSGIVHRDVKPSNIRILDDGSVKIMDFGIAKSMVSESTLTQTGITLGTASYLAPEQIRGEPVDQRTDIFSLGVLAYELLTFQKPFAGEHISTVLYKILNEMPPKPSEVVSGVPGDLEALVMRAIEKDRTRRPGSCAELRQELVAIAETVTGGRNISIPAPAPAPAESPVARGSLRTGQTPTPEKSRAELLETSALREKDRRPAPRPSPVSADSPADVPIRREGTTSTPFTIPGQSGGGALKIFLASVAFLLVAGAAAYYYFGPFSPGSGRGSKVSPKETPVDVAVTTTSLPATDGAPHEVTPGTSGTAAPVPTATTAPPTATPAPSTGVALFRPSVVARLTLNGKSRGEVPPSGLRVTLPPGRYHAVFDVQDFPPIEKEFDVKAGGTTTVEAPFPGRGAIEVSVVGEGLGAQVLVDDRLIGTAGSSPLRRFLPAGKHRLEVRKEGFETHARTIDVPEDDVAKVSVLLVRK